jgi:hypothetical protein
MANGGRETRDSTTSSSSSRSREARGRKVEQRLQQQQQQQEEEEEAEQLEKEGGPLKEEEDDEEGEEGVGTPTTSAAPLVRGSHVLILATENVLHRVPHLVDQVGIVQEVPQHPNTWFKVKCKDGKVYTLRPSALKVAEGLAFRALLTEIASFAKIGRAAELEPEEADLGPIPPVAAKPGKKAKGKQQLSSQEAQQVGDERVKKDKGGSAAGKTPSLSLKAAAPHKRMPLTTLDADLWVDRVVLITGGRLTGKPGKVLRSGNGWVQLLTIVGEIAKRAYELELISDEEAEALGPESYMPYPDGDGVGEEESNGDLSKDEDKGAKGRARAGECKDPEAEGMEEREVADEDANADASESVASASILGDDSQDLGGGDHPRKLSRAARKARRSEEASTTPPKPRGASRVGAEGRRNLPIRALKDKEKSKDDGTSSVASSSVISTSVPRRGSGASGKEKGGTAGGGTAGGAGGSGRGAHRHSPAKDLRDREKEREKLREREKEKALVQSREATKRHIETQMQRAKARPNLHYWLKELDRTASFQRVDPEDVDLNVDMMPQRCNVCYIEKSEGDKFCWNKECSASPIFDEYFKQGGDGDVMDVVNEVYRLEDQADSFMRHTVVDPALTYSLQAPVMWVETRKRRRSAVESFSTDPALYRWQCWASRGELGQTGDKFKGKKDDTPRSVERPVVSASKERPSSSGKKEKPSDGAAAKERSSASPKDGTAAGAGAAAKEKPTAKEGAITPVSPPPTEEGGSDERGRDGKGEGEEGAPTSSKALPEEDRKDASEDKRGKESPEGDVEGKSTVEKDPPAGPEPESVQAVGEEPNPKGRRIKPCWQAPRTRTGRDAGADGDNMLPEEDKKDMSEDEGGKEAPESEIEGRSKVEKETKPESTQVGEEPDPKGRRIKPCWQVSRTRKARDSDADGGDIMLDSDVESGQSAKKMRKNEPPDGSNGGKKDRK